MPRKPIKDNAQREKRKLQNREAAKRCRQKKYDTIKELEEKLKHLQELYNTKCSQCQHPELVHSDSESSASSPDNVKPYYQDNSPLYQAPSNYYAQDTMIQMQEVKIKGSPRIFTSPDMNQTLNALAFPGDVYNTTTLVSTKNPTPSPQYLLKPSPGYLSTMFSPGGLIVGGYRLGELVTSYTGHTPTLNGAWHIVFPPKNVYQEL